MREEQLSALLDGELQSSELESLLAELETSPALKARWSRMSAVRDAQSGTRVRSAPFDLTASVMAAVANEPQEEHLAAVAATALPQVSRVQPLQGPLQSSATRAARQPARPARRNRWQAAVGLSAAAAIAGVVFIGGRTALQAPVGTDPESSSLAAVSAPLAAFTASTSGNGRDGIVRIAADGSIVQGSFEESFGSSNDLSVIEPDKLTSDAARQLNDYLMEHSNSRAESGMGGSLNYARLAVRTADYRPADGSR